MVSFRRAEETNPPPCPPPPVDLNRELEDIFTVIVSPKFLCVFCLPLNRIPAKRQQKSKIKSYYVINTKYCIRLNLATIFCSV